ncbi:MAG: hypothetical protein GEU28_13380, partial [Dehalococcoidia bacterium]|nr:hypothetical protein [Dehalococcoidia bacterium]
MLNWLSPLAAVCLAASLLIACNDDDEDGNILNPTTTATEQATASATATAEATATTTPEPEQTAGVIEDVCEPNPSPVDESDPSIVLDSPEEGSSGSPIEVTGEA